MQLQFNFAQESTQKKTSKECLHCGKVFRCKPSHYDKKTYCSRACMAEGYRTRQKGEANPNYRGVMDGEGKHICPTCGKEFVSYSKDVKYCSQSCLALRPGNIARLQAQSPKAAAIHAANSALRKRTCRRCGTEITAKYAHYCKKCRIVRPAMKDANHDEIVFALRGVGAKVFELHKVGKGCPDLLVIYRGAYLLEVKNPRTKWKLTPAQKQWHDNWRGQVAIVENVDDALRQIGAI